MADTEKITINMSVVDLGRTDLLVEQGFYSNRTDFIRTAIRNQLDTHTRDIAETVQRKAIAVGVMGYNNADLKKKLSKNEKLDIQVVGMFVLGSDVEPEIAQQVIQSVKVFGVFKAEKAVKNALSDRLL